jgi:hypothetical protein
MSDAVLDTFETTLAACAGVQTFLGVASAVAAKARIHKRALPPPNGTVAEGYTEAELTSLRPFVLIYCARHSETGIAVNTFDEHGQLVAEFVRTVSAAGQTAPATGDTELAEVLDTIAGQVRNLAHTAGYLAATALRRSDPARLDPRDRAGLGVAQIIRLEVDY